MSSFHNLYGVVVYKEDGFETLIEDISEVDAVKFITEYKESHPEERLEVVITNAQF